MHKNQITRKYPPDTLGGCTFSPVFSSSGTVSASGASSSSLGLVYSSTSDTPNSKKPINPYISRLRRMKHGVITGARLHTEQATKGGFRYYGAMLTLTYAESDAWNPRHIADLLKSIRQWTERRGHSFRYVWVMELTKAGVPHYHVIIWLPKGLSLPKPDKQGWWKHGSTRIEKARNAVGYAAKYASKGVEGKKFPEGARIHACGGLSAALRNERAWWLCPAWVRKRWDDPAYQPRPCEGGGWIAKATGEWEPSPYNVTFSKGQIFIELRLRG